MRGAVRLSLACVLVTGFAAGGLVAGSGIASATVGSADAPTIAAALASPTANVTGASFVTTPNGTPDGTSDQSLAGFPTDGSSFGILTTGDVNSVPNPGAFANTDDGGDSARGDTDFDVSILKVDVDVPNGANCLGFDFKFLSEEYPRFVNTQYDDAFIAELDTSDWSTSGSVITAPNNFAFDGSGDVVSVNSTGIGGMTPADGAGTAFDGTGDNTDGAATGVLQAFHQVTPGAHSLYFSIFDQGDHALDSAVFLDNLRVGFVPSPADNCVQGATPVNYSLDLEPPTASNSVGTQHDMTATLTDQDGSPVAGAPIDFTVTGANPTTDTENTDDSGIATFSYVGANTGTDQISACYDADSSPPCEAVASATADWTSALGVDSTLTPNPVTEGDNVVDDITVTATDGANHNVEADVTSDFGGSLISASPSQGSCVPPDDSDNAVNCALGDLDNGASATIQVIFKVPKPAPEGGTFAVSTTATSDEAPSGVNSAPVATVTSQTGGTVDGYVTPGGTIQLGSGTPSPSAPTVATFTLPVGGPGVQMSLDVEDGPPDFCGGSPCQGQLLGVTDFAGYTNPLRPARIVLRFDKSLYAGHKRGLLYVQKSADGPITAIPYCGPRPGWDAAARKLSRQLILANKGPHSNYASPSPCINAKKFVHGYMQVQVLVLSGDPKIGFK